MITSLIPRLAALGVGLALFGNVAVRGQESRSPEDAANRTLNTANGLLARGLNKLAAAEYRRFLDEHKAAPRAPEAQYGLGVALVRQQQYADALQPLRAAGAETDFEFVPEATYLLGYCRLQTGDAAGAADVLSAFDRKLGSAELAPVAQSLAIEALCRAKRFGVAQRRANEWLRRNADDSQSERVRYWQALALTRLERWGDARSSLEALTSEAREALPAELSEHALLLLANCLQEGDELAGAAEAYQRLLEMQTRYAADALYGLATTRHAQQQWSAATKLYARFLESFEEDERADDVRIRLGQAHLAAGNADTARQVLEDVRGGDVAAARYWQAKSALRDGDAAAAAELLGTVLSRDGQAGPQTPAATYDYAVALARLKRINEALEVLDKFLARYANDALMPDALALAARLAHRSGAYERSTRYCERFAARFPDHAHHTADLALLAADNAYAQSKYKQAAAAFSAFAARFEGHPSAGEALVRAGLSHFAAGDYAAARALLGVEEGVEPELLRAALRARAEIAYHDEQWPEAADLLRRIADEDSDDADARLKLGVALHQAGRDREAIAALPESAPTGLPAEQEALWHMTRGAVLQALNRESDARRAFAAAVGADPSGKLAADAQVRHGVLAYGAGDYAAAAADFETALRGGRLVPAERARTLLRRGQALLAAGDAATAVPPLRESRNSGKLTDAQRSAATAALAIALGRLEQHAEALALLDELAADGWAHLPDVERNTLLYERIWRLRSLDRTETAGQAYEAALPHFADDERFPVLAIEAAGLQLEAGRAERALALLDQLRSRPAGSVAGMPPDRAALAQRYRAGALLAVGKPAEALTVAAEFLRRWPDHDDAVAMRAMAAEAALQSGRHAAAAEHLEQLTTLLTDKERLATAWLRLGECRAELQHWLASEQAYDQFLARFPAHSGRLRALFGRGWARENQRRYAEARKDYHAVATAGTSELAARAQFQLGECLFAEQKYDEATRALLKVDILYEHPQWAAAALFEAGRCLEAAGETGAARKQYQQVRERFADSRWAKPARQRLSAIAGGGPPGRAALPAARGDGDRR